LRETEPPAPATVAPALAPADPHPTAAHLLSPVGTSRIPDETLLLDPASAPGDRARLCPPEPPPSRNPSAHCLPLRSGSRECGSPLPSAPIDIFQIRRGGVLFASGESAGERVVLWYTFPPSIFDRSSCSLFAVVAPAALRCCFPPPRAPLA